LNHCREDYCLQK